KAGSATVGIKDVGTQGLNRLVVSQNSSSNALVQSFKAIHIVANTTPTANAGGPYDVTSRSTVVLDASGSSDADDPNASLSLLWALDGDGLFGETGPNAKKGDEVGINPTLNSTGLPVGPNTVKLEVVDTGGKWSVTTATINVKSASLTVTIDQAA